MHQDGENFESPSVPMAPAIHTPPERESCLYTICFVPSIIGRGEGGLDAFISLIVGGSGGTAFCAGISISSHLLTMLTPEVPEYDLLLESSWRKVTSAASSPERNQKTNKARDNRPGEILDSTLMTTWSQERKHLLSHVTPLHAAQHKGMDIPCPVAMDTKH